MTTIPSTPPTPTTGNNLFAAIDMGTNSFKLLIIRADPTTGKFLTLSRHKHPILLGLSPSLSSPSLLLRATSSLLHFTHLIHSHRIPPSHLRLVATSAIRESPHQSQFLSHIRQTLGLQIDVLSGHEEARLVYLGILQFYPVNNQTVLAVDIGGGSTEFVIGKFGKVLFSISLKLGHVTLTQQFVDKNDGIDVVKLREYIRDVVRGSGLVEYVRNCGFDVAIGSSGTVKAVEKAVFCNYGRGLRDMFGDFDVVRREWRFSKGELRGVVESLLSGEEGTREGFFKRRSEFIVAGAVLLEEIFGLLGIEEMEVSGYALGEGVIAEKLAEVFEGFDLNANARWRSVMRLATRFNNDRRMKAVALCAGIAKEMFEGLKNLNDGNDDQNKLIASLDDKDLEYLEAACLLHTIGLFTGKKAYHKQSYKIIMNGDHLHGYNAEEVKLIALLARHHRKKFPKLGHGSLEGFTKEAKQKFRTLCVIIRLCAVLKQYPSLSVQDIELSHSHDGFKLVLKEFGYQPPASAIIQAQMVDTVETTETMDIEAELGEELEHFNEVFKQKLAVEVLLCTSELSVN